MNVIVEIDELVLEGLGPLDGQAVRAAVEQELARLVATGGLRAGADARSLTLASQAASIRVNQLPAQSAPLGAQVAQAIYGGLAR